MNQHGILRLTVAGLINLAANVPLWTAHAQENGKTVILTPNAPKPVGPYSQAIQVGRTVYLSGQIAIDVKTNQPMANAPIEDQTRQVLENLQAVLAGD